MKTKPDKLTPFATPTHELTTSSPLKENISSTPKTPKLDFLNRSETLITSYCVSKSFSTPTKSCMSSKILTPGSIKKQNSFMTPSRSNLLDTPQKVLAEMSHNLIELNSTPLHGQKKSMHLIDLTTPFVKNSRHATSTPKITEKNLVSIRKDNTLLKSAIKNSTVKKRWAVNGRSIMLTSSTTKSDVKTNSSPKVESPLYASCCDSSSVIEVNETLDDTFVSIPPSTKLECNEETKTISMVVSSQNTNDAANSAGSSNMLESPQKYPKNDSRDVSGIRELMKTPTTHTPKVLNVIMKTPKVLNDIMVTSTNVSSINAEQSDSDEDGVRELLTSISNVLEDSNVISLKNETASVVQEELPSSSIKITEELPTDNTESVVSEKVVASIDVASSNVLEAEFKTMDRTFDELIGIPTITKTYNRKSSASVQDKIDEESANEMKLKEKECGERVIKWIEDVKASGSLERSNKTKQIISSRYSNVTPNDSLVDSTSLDKTSDVVDERSIDGNGSPRLSILETMEHLRQVKYEDSQINQKLTMSPVSRLSIMDNSTQVLENYHLQVSHEIPNSLRSTRKKFGMAFASLLNVSAQATEDPNESINNSMHSCNDEVKEAEESKSSSPNILSLDDYQQKDDLCGKENESPLYQSYIEFVKTDDCDEGSDNEVFEISDSNQSIDESIESDQSSENECDNDSSSEFDEFIGESGRRMNDKMSEDLFDDIKPIENSSDDDDETEADASCNVSRIDEQHFEDSKFILNNHESHCKLKFLLFCCYSILI